MSTPTPDETRTHRQARGLRPLRGVPRDFVMIEHPDIVDDEGKRVPTRVHRGSLPHWELRGWRERPADPVDPPAGAAAAQGQLTAQDPATAQTAAGPQNAAGDAEAESSRKASRRGATTGSES